MKNIKSGLSQYLLSQICQSGDLLREDPTIKVLITCSCDSGLESKRLSLHRLFVSIWWLMVQLAHNA